MTDYKALIGKPVKVTTRKRAFPADFPGWGAPGAVEALVEVPAGARGVIDGFTHHGAAPYTRFHVALAGGARVTDVDPEDLRIIRTR